MSIRDLGATVSTTALLVNERGAQIPTRTPVVSDQVVNWPICNAPQHPVILGRVDSSENHLKSRLEIDPISLGHSLVDPAVQIVIEFSGCRSSFG